MLTLAYLEQLAAFHLERAQRIIDLSLSYECYDSIFGEWTDPEVELEVTKLQLACGEVEVVRSSSLPPHEWIVGLIAL